MQLGTSLLLLPRLDDLAAIWSKICTRHLSDRTRSPQPQQPSTNAGSAHRYVRRRAWVIDSKRTRPGTSADEAGPLPREVRNACIFRFVCLESVACDPDAGAQPRHGRSAVALAEDLSGRPVPAGAVLYAWSRPETGEARALHWLLKPPRPSLLHCGEPHNSEPVFIEAPIEMATSPLPLIAGQVAPGARRDSRSLLPQGFRSGSAIRPW